MTLIERLTPYELADQEKDSSAIIMGIIMMLIGTLIWAYGDLLPKPWSSPGAARPSTTQQTLVPPAETQPSSPVIAASIAKSVQPVEVFDLVSLLNNVPTNQFVLSDEGGWDKFTMPKVQNWVNENLVGKRSRAHVYLLQCNVSQEDANSKPDEWTVNVQISGIHATYAGLPNRILPIDKDDQTNQIPEIGTLWGKANFRFKCSEAEARKWDALNKKPVPAAALEGDVVAISFQPRFANGINGYFIGYFIGYDTFVKLDNVVFAPLDDTEPGALYLPEFDMALYGPVREPEQAITEMKRLETSGDYQLIFMKYYEWVPQSDGRGTTTNVQKRITNKLLSFPLISESLHDFDAKMQFTPCDDPPSTSQIAKAKEATGWPKN